MYKLNKDFILSDSFRIAKVPASVVCLRIFGTMTEEISDMGINEVKKFLFFCTLKKFEALMSVICGLSS